MINRSADGVFIGGGGLLIPVSNQNSASGWHWRIPTDLVREFRPPLFVIGVGYNRFPHQEDFAPMFRRNIAAVVDKSAFFGLRNYGSVRSIQQYLPDELHDRVSFHPCMTTVLRHYWTDMTPMSRAQKDNLLVLNFSGDRASQRFGDSRERVEEGFAEIARWSGLQGWDIVIVTHARQDALILSRLRKAGVRCRVVHLERRLAHEIINFYREATLTVGMRGHSQMIPFGCGNAITSLVSHDKMRFFLDSIGHPEWGVDVLDSNFVDQVKQKIQLFHQSPTQLLAEVDDAQQRMWTITRHNFDLIGRSLAQG